MCKGMTANSEKSVLKHFMSSKSLKSSATWTEGYSGAVLRTEDGGRSWVSLTSRLPQALNGASIVFHSLSTLSPSGMIISIQRYSFHFCLSLSICSTPSLTSKCTHFQSSSVIRNNIALSLSHFFHTSTALYSEVFLYCRSIDIRKEKRREEEWSYEKRRINKWKIGGVKKSGVKRWEERRREERIWGEETGNRRGVRSCQ